MGMQMDFWQVTPSDAARIEADPRHAYELLFRGVDRALTPEAVAERIKKMESVTGTLVEREQDEPWVAELRAAIAGRRKANPEAARSFESFFEKLQSTIGAEGLGGPAGLKRLNIEKSWHAIHYLLTGRAEGGDPPFANAVLGGRTLPDDQGRMGYGPALYLSPAEVKEAALSLSGISEEKFLSAYNERDMKAKKIYGVHGYDEDAEFLSAQFRRLCAFYREAAGQGNGMIKAVT